ncbi:hypothetical protein CO046_00400 [Candidatus Peregrinibacteria bacterium CG_4_9_14_0_2_um_filter_53_11]|nr:MAG: hypothetical protein CO046_00400 [Candidatus Peregrinibacteria bacterium CG_4_9_14_0_2_um_filter_53_11]
MGKEFIQVPEKIPELIERTLVVCMARDFAKAYCYHLQGIHELPTIETSETDYHYTDKEGRSFISESHGGDRTNGTSGNPTIFGIEKHNKQHYLKVFLNHFSKELARIFREGSFNRVVLFVPDELHISVEEKLEQHLLQKTEFFSGNFTKHHPLELVEKIYEEKPHLFPIETPHVY